MFQKMVYPFLAGHIFTPFYWISQNHPFLLDQAEIPLFIGSVRIHPFYWINQNSPFLMDQAESPLFNGSVKITPVYWIRQNHRN